MSRLDWWPLGTMPERTQNPPTDADPRTFRNSVSIQVRLPRNRGGISNRRGSAIPMPMQNEYLGRDARSVPDHIEEPWRSSSAYSSSNGRVQMIASAANAYPLPIHGNFNNSPINVISGHSRIIDVNASPTRVNAGTAHAEARGRHPLRSGSTSMYPGTGPQSTGQDTATPMPTDSSSSNTTIRHASGDIFSVNTSVSDGWPLGLHSPSAPRSSPLNPVDFRELDYVNAVDQNLVCPICQCPMIEAVETECGHTFCSQCLRSAMIHQYDAKTCPSCRNPLALANIYHVNRLVDRMLDDLVVSCVSKSKGCLVTLARSNILDHVDRHCAFSDVPCPDSRCRQVLQRRRNTDGCCQHGPAICEYCPEIMPELELEDHVKTSCVNRVLTCNECKSEMFMDQAEYHKNICAEAIIPCDASFYGCTFTGKREEVGAHSSICPLSMLRPHLVAQRTRFESYESTLERMQRQNNIYKEFMVTVERVLARRAPSPVPGVPPYHGLSQPTHPHSEQGSHQPANHLLALHQSLREDVARVRNAVTEIDARASTISINDNLRHAEEMSRLNATIVNLRTQVQWLITSQRQRNEQRALRSHSSGGSGQVLSGLQEGTSTHPDVGVLGFTSDRRPSDPKL